MNCFQVLPSDKTGLDATESYVVARDGISYLRVLGADPSWDLMTATASEDRGHVRVCSDQLRLVESALRLRIETGGCPVVKKDWLGREYVKICVITRNSGVSDEEFDENNNAFFRRFFEIFDGYKDLNSRDDIEMRELYDALAVDDEGGDVYLSDGVWLSSDGSLHDRGR